MSTLLAIDVSNFIARYVYANPQVTPSQITRAAHAQAQKLGATEIVGACDDVTSWREAYFEGHKQGRGGKPPHLRQLLDTAAAVFHSGGIPTLHGDGKEADDLLAYAAQQHDGPSYLWTNDKDLYACLDEHTTVISGTRFITPQTLLTDYGVTPASWPLYRAITGDPSDGHRGIPGLGPKAAQHICQACITSQEALDWARSQPSKHGQKLLEHADQLRLYERLARLDFSGIITRRSGP